MKKWLFAGAAVILLGLICVAIFFPWGYFKSPGDAVTQTLTAANEGRYDEADSNLNEIRHGYFKEDPAGSKPVWDRITRNRTIAKVVILQETMDWTTCKVATEIHYKDGTILRADEGCYFEQGKWRLSLGMLMHAVADDVAQKNKEEEDRILAPLLKGLPEEYTPLDGTNVALRLPLDMEWDKAKGVYVHPKVALVLSAHYYPGFSRQTQIDETNLRLKARPGAVIAVEDVKLGATPGKLWTLDAKTGDGPDWVQMYLVVGTDVETTVIVGQCLKGNERLAGLVKECLLSAHWTPRLDPQLPGRIPYTVRPTEELSLKQVMVQPFGVCYHQTGKLGHFQPHDPIFTVWSTLLLPPVPDKRAAFEGFLKRIGSNYTDQKIEKITPLTVDGLEGFESFGTAFNTAVEFQAFLYTAVLFKNNEEVYVLSGVVGVPGRPQFEPQFMAMARSFKTK